MDLSKNTLLGLPPGSAQSRIILGYYENPWPGTSDKTGSFPSMKIFAKAVAPFWYRADKQGGLDSKDSQLVYDTARQLGIL